MATDLFIWGMTIFLGVLATYFLFFEKD